MYPGEAWGWVVDSQVFVRVVEGVATNAGELWMTTLGLLM